MHRLTTITGAQAQLTATLTKLDTQDVTQSERVAAQEAHVARVSAAAAGSSTNGEITDGNLHVGGSEHSAR